MKFLRHNRGQIEKLLMFVAMISVAAIAIYMIRSVVMRQDPCARYEEPQTGFNPMGGCLDDLAIVASQCVKKYDECKQKRIEGNMLKCFVLSKQGMLSECMDTSQQAGGFMGQNLCDKCCGWNSTDSTCTPNYRMNSDPPGVLRFDYDATDADPNNHRVRITSN